MANLNVVSINVRGLNDKVKRKTCFSWIKEKKIDIAFLQETFCIETFKNTFDNDFRGKVFHGVTDSTHSRGVCIMVREGLEFTKINEHRTIDGRRVLVNANINGNDITLVCLYAPNTVKDRSQFFDKSRLWIEKYALFKNSMILAGDLNCCLRDCDRRPIVNIHDNSRKSLQKLIDELELYDSWSKLHNTPGYTFFDKRTGGASRLDYILCGKMLSSDLKSICVNTCPVSDHESVTANLCMGNQKRGRGYWKLNNSLINNQDYIDNVKKLIVDTQCELKDIKSYRLTWELLKIRIKEFSIKYSVCKKRSECSRKMYIEHQLNNIIEKLNVGENIGSIYSYQTLIEEKVKLENELKEIYNNKSKGNIIRSRVKWVEEGERNSKYFLTLEKSRQSNNVIRRVNTGSETVISSQLIINEISNYYKKLYSPDDVQGEVIMNYLNSISDHRQLSNDEKILCDEEVTVNEIKQAVSKIRRNRSPGLDGLSPEFYKMFYDDLEELYIGMLRETYKYGEMPDSMKYAIITLIYKKGDNYMLKNYRPISLTNYDYKILAYILATRMQKVIKTIIDEDQTGYIKGRYIGCNIRILEDLLEYCYRDDKYGALICLDFEKAFDSVNWDFMFATLKFFNFGDKFIKWIRILYNDPLICVKNNGWVSDKFSAGRGVRQGCPVSALLFLLVVEIMAIKLRNCQNVNGFQIDDCTFKLTQYADDTTLLLSDTQSITNALHVITQFSQVSGLNLNVSKCEGIWLGKNTQHVNVCNGIKFTKGPIKCLGIYIGGDKKERKDLNWCKKLEFFDQTLEGWKERYLTIFGKTIVLKSLAISQLIFNFSLLNVDDDITKHVNRSMYNFIWNAKDRIKRNVLIGPYDKGGIKMIDLDCKIKSLKAAWVTRIQTNKNAKWLKFCHHFLKEIGLNIDILFLMNFRDIKEFPEFAEMPPFYCNIFTAFNEMKNVKQINVMNDDEFLSQIIWGNRLFLINNKCILFKTWIDSGIIFVKDVFTSDGVFVNETEILDRLLSSRNWISEYYIARKCITRVSKAFDCSKCIYINVNNIYSNCDIVYKNKRFDVSTLKSNFYYNIVVDKKSVRNYSEMYWQNLFGIKIFESEWSDIYYENVWNLPVKKIGEFKYKLLHLLLPCKYTVSKWKQSVTSTCNYCNDTETVHHKLFSCRENIKIWRNVGRWCNIDIKWKHIVLGFREKSDNSLFYNIILSTLAFCIHKIRFYQDLEQKYDNYQEKIKSEYIRQIFVFKHMNIYRNHYNRMVQLHNCLMN